MTTYQSLANEMGVSESELRTFVSLLGSMVGKGYSLENAVAEINKGWVGLTKPASQPVLKELVLPGLYENCRNAA